MDLLTSFKTRHTILVVLKSFSQLAFNKQVKKQALSGVSNSQVRTTLATYQALLNGLGVKLSYNYADSDFEFEDSRYGDAFQTQLDGTVIQTAQGIIAPAGLPGLSKHTASAQVYYQIGALDMQVNYKYRDDYFQPFTSDGTRLRFVGDVGVWEARASYELTENLKLSVEAINLFSQPKEQYAFVTDDLYEVNDYGPRVFFGLRGKF